MTCADTIAFVAGGGNMAVYPDTSLNSLTSDSVSLFTTEYSLREPIKWIKGAPIDQYASIETIEEKFATLRRLKYVVVIRMVEHVAPLTDSSGFTKGSYRGEAHLIELSGRHLGGFRFHATNSDKVTFTRKVERDTDIEISRNDDGMVGRDLYDQAFAALVAGMKKHIPSVDFGP